MSFIGYESTDGDRAGGGEQARMAIRIKDGVRIGATQRSNRNEDVPVRNLLVFTTGTGLHLKAEIGDGRGYTVEVVLSLEELVAQMPEIVADRAAFSKKMTKERAQKAEAEKRLAVLTAEQRMRELAAEKATALGVTLPFLAGDPVYKAQPAE